MRDHDSEVGLDSKAGTRGFSWGFSQQEGSLRGTCPTTKTEPLNSVCTVTTFTCECESQKRNEKTNQQQPQKVQQQFFLKKMF